MCLTNTILEESVLVVPVVDLWKLLPYKETGFTEGNIDSLSRVVGKGLFRKRSGMEENSSFKQLITYAVISNEDSYYLFRRMAGQAEKRLHNKLHLGVGGHVNPDESFEPDTQYLISELKRELFEEVKFLNDCTIERITFTGFINDDTIPVGRFHLGLMYEIRISSRDIIINETDKMCAEWVDRPDLGRYYEEMETWTKVIYDFYIK